MPRLELFEVADRAVACRGKRAWVFEPGRGWGDAPGLVARVPGEGIELEPESFARHFPEAARHAIPQGEPQRRRLFGFSLHH